MLVTLSIEIFDAQAGHTHETWDDERSAGLAGKEVELGP
jgi:hypothetical protein